LKRILVANIFKNQQEVNDIYYRLYHHFQFVEDIAFVLLKETKEVFNNITCPDYFGGSIDSSNFIKFTKKIKFKTVFSNSDIENTAKTFKLLMIYDEIFYKAHHSILKSNNPKMYWCDPNNTRQEGSNYIQAALDTITSKGKSQHIIESIAKFKILQNELEGKYEEAVLLATGPSIENFREYDLSDKLCIACNSTILNEELVAASKPKILVFADPIFHFGVSLYADAFRENCKKFMSQNEDVKIVIPIKYYALLLSLFPGFESRIIGVPFTKHEPINLKISEDAFYTFTTSNILTLLLLPLATTFAKKVNLIGCDGRPLDKDDYFWGHGKTVQINDKMANIKICHPGFFNIDYNEYYFQHCHTLDNIINYAEQKGYAFSHLGESHIPVLSERALLDSQPANINDSCRIPKNTLNVLIEPDGIETKDGHYHNWHLNLSEEISNAGGEVEFWVNNKCLYPAAGGIFKRIFAVNSWQLQRGAGCLTTIWPYGSTCTQFYGALRREVSRFVATHGEDKPIHFFMYYGSTQVVKCFQELEKEFSSLSMFFSICIFSESVKFKPESPIANFHPNAKLILTEACAKKNNYRIFSVTQELSKAMFKEYEVKTLVMTHPIINMAESLSIISRVESEEYRAPKVKDKIVLCFPTNFSHGKSEDALPAVIMDICNNYTNIVVKIRKNAVSKWLVEQCPGAVRNGRLIEVDAHDYAGYIKNLKESDVVMIPYPKSAFYARTSGILFDCILCKTPVITMADTWLSRQAISYQTGLYVSILNSKSLISAVSKVCSNATLFEQTCKNASDEIIVKNTFGKLYEQIFASSINQFEGTK
jgi:hypothetical protein